MRTIDRMHVIVIVVVLDIIEIVCVSTLVAEDGAATEAHNCAEAV